MKKYLLLLLLLISGVVSAQYPITGSKVRYYNGIGLSTRDTTGWGVADTSVVIMGADSVPYYRYKGYWRQLGGGGYGKVAYTDTAAMLSPYLRSFLGVKYTDTSAMLGHYFNMTASNALLALKVNISDTAAMLGNYYNKTALNSLRALDVKYTDTATILSAYYNKTATDSKLALKLNISDTANMLSPYARTLALGGYVPYSGATKDVNIGTKNYYGNAYFDGFTSVAASGTLITLTVSSTPSYLITGSGGQTIKLPDATTLPNGAVYVFNNNQSSGAINVNNNSNTLVKSVPSGGYLNLELIDNSTAAGSWDAHFQAPSNVSWSTNTFDYPGSITSATWNGNTIAINRGGTGASTSGGALTNLGAQPQLNGTGFVKASGTTISYDNSTYLTSADIVGKVNYTDTASMLSGYYRSSNPSGYITSSAISGKVNYTDTSSMLSPYLRSLNASNTYLTQTNAASTYYLQTNPSGYITSSAISGKVNYTDTASMLSTHPNTTLVNSLNALNVKYTDTALMLTPYYNKTYINSRYGNVVNTDTSFVGTNYFNKTYVTSNLATKQNTLSLTVTGSSGASTLVGATLNIPTYTLAGLGGISLTSLSATSPIFYNNTTGVISSQAATTSLNGYLTSTDWTTFNGKQATITLTTTGTSGAATFASNTLNIPNYTYTLPTATNTVLGGVKPDGTSILNTAGVISVTLASIGAQAAGSYQPLATNLTSIGALANGSGALINNGSGTFSYATPWTGLGYLTSATGVTTFSGSTTGLTPSTATSGAITLGGTLVVGNGGTGVATLTGIVKGNGTSAFTAAVAGTDYQAVINGTGFVKASGTTISYDNSTYLTTSTAASTYSPIAGSASITTLGTIASGSIPYSLISGTPSLAGYVPYTGATGAVNLGTNTLSAGAISGSSTLQLGNITNGSDGGVTARAVISNPSNADQYVGIGYDNTGQYGFIHAIHRATAWKNLVIAGFGGNVLVGTTTDNGSKFQVAGAATFSSSVQATSGTFSGAVSVNSSAANVIALDVSANTGNGVRQRFLNQSASGLYNFQIGTHISAANIFEIGVSSATDGTSFNNIFKIANTGAATFSSTVTATDFRYTNNGYLTYDVAATGTNTMQIRSGYAGPVLSFTGTGAATFSSSVTASNYNASNTTGYLLRENSGSGYGLYKNTATDIGIAANGVYVLQIASTGAATFSSTINSGAITSSGGIKFAGSNSGTTPFALGSSSPHFQYTNGGAYGLTGDVLTNGNSYLQATRVDATATAYDLLLQPLGGAVIVGGSLSSGAITSANINIGAGGSDYPNGQLEFTNTTSGSYVGIASNMLGSPTMYFDHRGASNTGGFAFRNGTGAGTSLLTIASTGAATFSSSVTATSFIGNLNYTLTFGTHMTGTSFNNSGAVTIATDAATTATASTLVARDGSGYIYAVSFFESSDARLKNIIARNNDMVLFKWKPELKRDTKFHYGYIAQEVKKFMPDAVNKDDGGNLSVDYVQVHTLKINKLENEITELKKEIEELKKLIKK